MLLASSNPISQIAHPLFEAFARLLAFFYSAIANYAVAIALLTIVVMVVVFPITRKGTRSMMRMQIYAPEMKKIQQRYKAPAGATPAEKTALRQQANEEIMAFYKENNISPVGGCLPMFLQLPIFWILYGTIRGLIHTTTTTVHGVKHIVANPLYIPHTSSLYQAIIKANTPTDVTHFKGIRLESFGLNLANSVRSPGSFATKIPYIALILVAVALQYVQMKQLNGRNPAAAAANPQMQSMQKIMPIVFLFIYIAIPAGVNVYFIVSSLFRIGQQEYMYRHDKQLKASLHALRERHDKAQAGKPAPVAERPRGLRGLLGASNLLGTGTPDSAGGAGKPGGTSSPGSGIRPARGKSSGAGARPATANKSYTPPRAERPTAPAKGSGAAKTNGTAKTGAAAKTNGTPKTTTPRTPGDGPKTSTTTPKSSGSGTAKTNGSSTRNNGTRAGSGTAGKTNGAGGSTQPQPPATGADEPTTASTEGSPAVADPKRIRRTP